MFWHNHPVKDLLAEDVKNGLANELAPKVLHETREEYKVFKLETFRKHIYQEKSKQRSSCRESCGEGRRLVPILTQWAGCRCRELFITVGDNSDTLDLASNQPLILE